MPAFDPLPLLPGAAASWKPVLTALLLPPAPLLLALLGGAWLARRRRRLGWIVMLLGAAGLWASACTGVAAWLTDALLRPPPVLDGAARHALRAEVAAGQPVAIVVLGAGREGWAPEYGTEVLTAESLARLRYGTWLSRETGAPLLFSGGVGWAQRDGIAESALAARLAADTFGQPLRWREDGSRDTAGNATRSVALLAAAGVREIVLVTHAWHMPRALRHFRAAAAAQGLRVRPAPMGQAVPAERELLRWLPGGKGSLRVHRVLREVLARLAGA